MKRAMMCALTVMAISSVAFAVPSFDLGMSPFSVDKNGPAGVVELKASNVTGSFTLTGMNLYIYVTGPFTLDAIEVDNIGGVWNTSPSPATSGGTTVVLDSPNSGYAYANPPASGGANPEIVNGSLLAKLTISVVPGTLEGATGAIYTGSPDYAESDWGADGLPASQAGLNLVVTPEPASALLLLGALPLIRRRRA